MLPSSDRIRRAIALAIEGEMVPFVSLWLIVGAVVITGFDYALLVEGATLMFYAVLVAVWTSLAATEPLQVGGTYAQFEFLVISTGAVVVGFGIEWSLAQLSGQLFAVQALAIVALVTRLYVNSLDGVSLERTVRWQDPVDRYLVYVPCLTALALPIVLHQLAVATLLGYQLQTPEGLLAVGGLGVLLGGVLFLLLEWRPRPERL